MKPFQFTLEALRTLRQRQEQKALEVYAQALLARQQAMDRLKSAQHELDVASQGFNELMEAGCTALEAARASDYQRVLVWCRDDCAKALSTAERRVNATLQTVLAARKQCEIVEKFFEKQKARHERGLALAEQKLLDDLASRRGASLFALNPNAHPA